MSINIIYLKHFWNHSNLNVKNDFSQPTIFVKIWWDTPIEMCLIYDMIIDFSENTQGLIQKKNIFLSRDLSKYNITQNIWPWLWVS
jgi:hypothetical protein